MKTALPTKTVPSLLLVVVLAVLLLAGCGSDGSNDSAATTQGQPTTQAQADEEPATPSPAGASARSCTGGEAGIEGLRVTGIDCGDGQAVAAAWSSQGGCASPADSSRFSCSVRGYRCLGTVAEHGIAVSCARPGRSIAFLARRG